MPFGPWAPSVNTAVDTLVGWAALDEGSTGGAAFGAWSATEDDEEAAAAVFLDWNTSSLEDDVLSAEALALMNAPLGGLVESVVARA